MPLKTPAIVRLDTIRPRAAAPLLRHRRRPFIQAEVSPAAPLMSWVWRPVRCVTRVIPVKGRDPRAFGLQERATLAAGLRPGAAARWTRQGPPMPAWWGPSHVHQNRGAPRRPHRAERPRVMLGGARGVCVIRMPIAVRQYLRKRLTSVKSRELKG